MTWSATAFEGALYHDSLPWETRLRNVLLRIFFDLLYRSSDSGLQSFKLYL